jgi:mannose-6-phosphate isomerase class I
MGQPEDNEGFTRTLLAQCDYFQTEIIEVKTKASFNVNDESFVSILCLEGDTEIAYGKDIM